MSGDPYFLHRYRRAEGSGPWHPAAGISGPGGGNHERRRCMTRALSAALASL